MRHAWALLEGVFRRNSIRAKERLAEKETVLGVLPSHCSISIVEFSGEQDHAEKARYGARMASLSRTKL